MASCVFFTGEVYLHTYKSPVDTYVSSSPTNALCNTGRQTYLIFITSSYCVSMINTAAGEKQLKLLRTSVTVFKFHLGRYVKWWTSDGLGYLDNKNMG